MGFLDRPLNDLSMGGLLALIRREVSSQVPPIPSGVAKLADLDQPVVKPDAPNTGEALYWNAASGDYESSLVDTQMLSPTIVLATEFIAGDPNAAHMELGVNPDNSADLGLRSFDASLNNTFTLDGQDGSVYMKGRLDWGTTSRLLQSDIVEMSGQVASGFQTPARVQSTNLTFDGGDPGAGGSNFSGTANVRWPASTSPGACLLMVVSQKNPGGSNPTIPTVAGWTQVVTSAIATVDGGHMRQTLFKIENSPTRSGNEGVALTGTSLTRYLNIRMYEYSGVNVVDLTPAAATGSPGAVASTATGVLTQAGELLFGAFSADGDSTGVYSPFSNAGESKATHTTSHPSFLQTDLDTLTFELITTSTASVQFTGTSTANWIAQVVTFKAASATGGVGTPDSGHTRLYAQNNAAAHPILHQTDAAGVTGSLAMGPQGAGWQFTYQTATISIPSTAGNAGGSLAVTLTCSIGDIVIWLGTDAVTPFFFSTIPVVTVGSQVTLNYRNSNAAAAGPNAYASHPHSFLVIHLT